MTKETMLDDINKLTFEEALKELEEIVRGLENGSSALDDAINSYARGAAIKKHCEKKLNDAQMRIEKIVVGDDGQINLTPLKIDE